MNIADLKGNFRVVSKASTAPSSAPSPLSTAITQPKNISDLGGKFRVVNKTSQPSDFSKFFGGVADVGMNVGKGLAKSGIETVKGLSDFGNYIAKNTVGRLGNATAGKGFTAPDSPGFTEAVGGEKNVEKLTKPVGASEGAGYVSGTVGQFLIPGGQMKEIEGAIDAIKTAPELTGYLGKLGAKNPELWGNFLINMGKRGLKILANGFESAGITGLQTEDKKSSIETGIIGGMSPVLGEVAGGLKNWLPNILGFTSGIKPGAIKAAQDDPQAIAEGLKMTSADVRSKADKALGGLYRDMLGTFKKGLNDLQKKTPFQAASKQFNNIRSFFGSALNDVKAGVPSIFRDFGVSVKDGGRTLDFDSLNSPIIKASEQNNLQRAWDTILRQTNFSPVGIQRVAARIEALTKYGENNETSAIITKMKNAYDGVIEKFHPELHSLRTTYGKTSQALEDISSIIGSSKDSPTKIQSSVNKLTKIFNDDQETYLNIIKDFAQRTGTNFPALIASDEFKKIMPDFIRGVGGGGVVALGAHMVNPWIWLLAPLFSPKAVGSIVTKGAAIAPAIGSMIMAGAKAVPPTLNSVLSSGTHQKNASPSQPTPSRPNEAPSKTIPTIQIK